MNIKSEYEIQFKNVKCVYGIQSRKKLNLTFLSKWQTKDESQNYISPMPKAKSKTETRILLMNK